MRHLFGILAIAVLIVLLVLFITAFGATGIAAVGWLLHRWFGLTQWQGSLLALGVMTGLAVLVYKLMAPSPMPTFWEGDLPEWEEDFDEPEEVVEPPIVPWRRNRPTPGELPPQKPAPRTARKRK